MKILTCFFVLALGVLCAQAAVVKQLRDPFERLASVAPAAPAAGGEGLAAAPAPEWKPELRAVMVDPRGSLVNLSGTILAVGESVNGYRVVRVAERSVVLAKAGKTITLTMNNKGTPE